MLTQQRKAHILEILKRDGHVVAKSVSQALGLSEDTIRRDLRQLAAEGRLQRVHGGAMPISEDMPNFPARRRSQSKADAASPMLAEIATPQRPAIGKAAIGRAAARLVRSGQTVFLDGGVAAVHLARNLPSDLVATVVTHSPSVALELLGHRSVTVDLIGGRLFKRSVVAVGGAAIEAIGRVKADTYFMAVTGVHPTIGLTTTDAEEVAVKRRLCRSAGETVVLASKETLGTTSPFLVVPAGEVKRMVVESDTEESSVAPYRAMGVAVIFA
jgi:DeoR/GlpR family transcriptional regulator of sugar metabolism